jgi:uncharacterized protein (TIGR02996 family)
VSDGDALLAAIAAHPDDDTPRLVYADWLDEHNDPGPAGRASSPGGAGPGTNAIRAEFIRVQVAVHRLEARPAEEQREHVHLWRRQQELLDNHRRDLLGPIADEMHALDAVFERGFLSQVQLSAPAFLKNARSVAALRPAPRVRLECTGEVQLAAVVACAEAACVESLALSGSVPARLYADLGNARHFARLEVLRVRYGQLGDTELAVLANGVGLPRLSELDLEAAYVTDAGLRALVASLSDVG